MFLVVKLNVERSKIEKLIGKLSELLLEITKLNITEAEFIINFHPIVLDKVHMFWERVDLKKNLIKKILTKTGINYANFSTLNWRLENTVSIPFCSQYDSVRFIFII